MTTKLNMRLKGNYGMTMAGQAVEPDILTGSDYCWELTNLGLKRTADGFFVLPTQVGEMLTGKGTTGQKSNTTRTNVVACYTTTPDLEEFWDLETLGIKDSLKVNDDDQALKQFYQTLEFKYNRYVVSWPYKGFNKVISDNYQLCYFRLRSVFNRLSREHLLHKYDEIIQNQLADGIIEKVKDNKAQPTVSYLPHHLVVTPGKQTTKVRIVYDASAKPGKNAVSLNDSLYRGPVMLSELCGKLLRF